MPQPGSATSPSSSAGSRTRSSPASSSPTREGYYTDAGFDSVTLVPGPSTGAAELISGSADVALSDAVSIGSVVASEGAPLKIIGTTYQKNPFTVLSLADGGDIATPEDLIGKKIGVQDSNTALFKALLAANDIEESELDDRPRAVRPGAAHQRRGRRLHRLPDERGDHGRRIGRRDDQPAVRRQRPAVRRRDHHGDRRRDRERPREAQGVPGRGDQGLDRWP